jgi:NAD dependent epimerase/dehydratase family enzyme
LASQRIVPRKLLDAGFVFRHPTIDEGLVSVLRA